MKTAYALFMTFSIFILALVLFIKQNTQTILGNESSFYTASVYLNSGLTSSELQSIQSTIQSYGPSHVSEAKVISVDAQLRDFLTAMPSYTKELVDGAEIKSILNPLVEVRLNPQGPNHETIGRIKSIPGVEQVTFASEWIEKIRSLFSSLDAILKSVFLLFFTIISFLIALIIRNYLLAEKENISVYCLHGATPHQTLVNQFCPLAIYTFISYVGAILLLAGAHQLLAQSTKADRQFGFLIERLEFLRVQGLAVILAGLVLNLGLSYVLSYRYVVRSYYRYE